MEKKRGSKNECTFHPEITLVPHAWRAHILSQCFLDWPVCNRRLCLPEKEREGARFDYWCSAYKRGQESRWSDHLSSFPQAFLATSHPSPNGVWASRLWDVGHRGLDLGLSKKARSAWFPPFLQAPVFPTAPGLPTCPSQALSLGKLCKGVLEIHLLVFLLSAGCKARRSIRASPLGPERASFFTWNGKCCS